MSDLSTKHRNSSGAGTIRLFYSVLKDGIAILGDMFELGERTELEHNESIRRLTEHGIDECILVGKAFAAASESHANETRFETTAAAAQFLKSNTIHNATILIKGSRSMKLEELLELL